MAISTAYESDRALRAALVAHGAWAEGDELLSRDQVADLIDVKPPTITHYASQSACKPEGNRDQWDMPLPVGYVRVERGDYPGMGPRRTRDPRWSRNEILAWRAYGRRPPFPERERYPRGHPRAGGYAPRPGRASRPRTRDEMLSRAS